MVEYVIQYLEEITSIRDILTHVYGLLLHPDWDDPLDSVLRQQWADNRSKFEDAAFAFVCIIFVMTRVCALVKC